MRMLMPTHVKKVQLWPHNAQPLFAHQQVESMLDAMLNPTVQLRSGGYLVINQTEALVAIDVNSGRSTRERGIEETALRTNLEAAEEAARQLRLRDLAGLIVIDFIDMESKKHNAMVERRMAEALKNDRARIQIGHISHFGLLELSRQRLRPSLAETSLNICQHCGGTGHVRSTESAALHVLREIEEEGGRRRAAEILVHLPTATAIYILNHKRQRLTEIEQRYAMSVSFAPDETLLAAQTRIDRLRAAVPSDLPPPLIQAQPMPEDDAGEADITEDEEDIIVGEATSAAQAAPAGDYTTDADHVPGETAEEGEKRRKRRRRRRRGRNRDESAIAVPPGTEQPDIADLAMPSAVIAAASVPGHDEASEAAFAAEAPEAKQSEAPDAEPSDRPLDAMAAETDGEPARAKRGRRGGRRRRKTGEDTLATTSPMSDEPVEGASAYAPASYTPPPYTYVGPTPADPFAMAGLDIFEALEQAELQPLRAMPPQPPEDPAAQAEDTPPVAAPAIKPVIIGSAEIAATDRKKGWWRR
jgi:ribonuclease E